VVIANAASPNREEVPAVDSYPDGHLWRPGACVRLCPGYSASTTVHTTVAVLPPMFRVAKRRAPSTW
jgi:hypothetical protein